MEIPFLQEEELRRRAADVLAHAHVQGEIPTPIEKIVEFHYSIDIVPHPGLIDVRGINGFLTSDRTAIYVDEGLFRRRATRYLFTLAHELGHWLLHEAHYEKFNSPEEWENFHAELEIQTISSAEWQADTLAGLLLVPPDLLSRRLVEIFGRLSKVVLAERSTFDLTSDAFWSYVAEEVGKVFLVSGVTARIRMENDQLWRRIP